MSLVHLSNLELCLKTVSKNDLSGIYLSRCLGKGPKDTIFTFSYRFQCKGSWFSVTITKIS